MSKFLMVTASVFALVAGNANAANRPPNVLLMLADDLGWREPEALTPRISALADESATYQYGYANPTCSPTRAAMFTGRYAERAGIRYALPATSTVNMPLSEVTLGEQFKGLGYTTALLGKWHLGRQIRPAQQGYDFFFGSLHGVLNAFTHRTPAGQLDWWRNDSLLPGDRRYYTDAVADEAISFIDRTEGPWFMTLAWHAVHVPNQAPNGTINYDAQLRALDTGVGRVLDALDARGLSGDTIVWFVGDNGGGKPARNGGLRGVKATLWEGGIRVATQIRWPGHIPAGPRTGATHVIDALPTMMELVDGAPARPSDGISIAGNLLWQTPLPERELNWAQGGRPVFAATSGQWKYITNGGLYNVVTDPRETTNVAGARPAIVADLKGQIAAWRNEVGR